MRFVDAWLCMSPALMEVWWYGSSNAVMRSKYNFYIWLGHIVTDVFCIQDTKVGVTSAPVEGLVAGSTLTIQECQMVKDAVAQVGSEGMPQPYSQAH